MALRATYSVFSSLDIPEVTELLFYPLVFPVWDPGDQGKDVYRGGGTFRAARDKKIEPKMGSIVEVGMLAGIT